MAYFLSPALVRLRSEINSMWPWRDRGSDGWIGDTSHQARKSDHNPDYSAGGIVRAIDIDKDGVPADTLVNQIIRDPRVAYVIWNARIWENPSTYPGRGYWRPYTGSNAHRQHFHVSVRRGSRWDRDGSPWNLAPTIPVNNNSGNTGNVPGVNVPGLPDPIIPKDWFDMATREELVEVINETRPVQVWFFAHGNATYEADVEQRTYRALPNAKTLADRKTVLTRSGVKWANWSGQVENPDAFGTRV